MAAENDSKLTGDLTIRGVTRPVTLDVRYLGQWDTPFWEDGVDKGRCGAPGSLRRPESTGTNMTSVGTVKWRRRRSGRQRRADHHRYRGAATSVGATLWQVAPETPPAAARARRRRVSDRIEQSLPYVTGCVCRTRVPAMAPLRWRNTTRIALSLTDRPVLRRCVATWREHKHRTRAITGCCRCPCRRAAACRAEGSIVGWRVGGRQATRRRRGAPRRRSDRSSGAPRPRRCGR